MKENFKLGFILLIYCAFFAGILAYVNMITKPVIDQRKAKEEEVTRNNLMNITPAESTQTAKPTVTSKNPKANTMEKKTAAADPSFTYYVAYDANGDIKGYSFLAARKGYSSIVKTMVSLDKDLKISTIKVIDQNETPGLGTGCVAKDFPDRFKHKGYDELKVDKDGGTIPAMTGATITTRAITNSLRDGIGVIQKDIKSNQPASAPQGGKK